VFGRDIDKCKKKEIERIGVEGRVDDSLYKFKVMPTRVYVCIFDKHNNRKKIKKMIPLIYE
jgi:hypothetical protein